MFDYSNNTYQQALIILDSSVGALELPAAPVSAGNSLTQYSKIVLYDPSLTESPNIGDTGSQITRTSFSSVPALWDWELNHPDYQELGEALREITELEEGDDWHIEPSVYNAARYIASELLRLSFPVPQIFSHGPKSIVFNWSSGINNLYLTISANRMSALISSPERIQRRIDYSANQLIDSALALSSIEAAYSDEPVTRLITGSTSDPRELRA